MKLEKIIKNTIIQKSAPLGFDEFMDLALYHPTQGYYRAGWQKFGRRGDFITAPETSDLFGFCLARQCAEVLDEQGDILEFGAGSGALAAQILFELGRLGKLPKNYYILELSAELKDRQHKALSKVLPELMERIIWLKSLPENFSGVVIANEVLDALPAKRLIKKADGFRELGVDYQAGELVWQEFNQPYINDKILLPNQAENGYTTEINPRALAWINTLGEVLERGLILLIDYGFTQAEFFHPQRHAGTLRCYYQHQASDNPFVNIGAQDITTSVNFSALAQQAKKSGLSVEGFATQAMFLISLGISEYLSAENNKQKRTELAAEIKQLVLPGAMGESFKVLALSKKTKVKSGKLTGFLEQDLTYKL